FAEGDRPFLFHAGVHEAPTDRRVRGVGRLTTPRLAGFQHDVRCACHAFDTAGDKRLAFARLDRLSGTGCGLEPRAAQPIHGLAGYLDRQSGKEQGHPRDIAIVFAGLVRAPEDDIVDRVRIDAASFDYRFDWNGSKIVGTDAGQRAPVFSDGRPQRDRNKRITHPASRIPFPVSRFPSYPNPYGFRLEVTVQSLSPDTSS